MASLTQAMTNYILENLHYQVQWKNQEDGKMQVYLDAWDCYCDPSYDNELTMFNLTYLILQGYVQKITIECCYEDHFIFGDGSKGYFWRNVPDHIIEFITKRGRIDRMVFLMSS